MNYKSLISLSLAVAALAGTSACSDKNDGPTLESKNHLYLTLEGNNGITDNTDESLQVKVELSDKPREATSIEFSVENDPNGAFKISDNPIRFEAGQTSASFYISLAKNFAYTEQQSMTIAVKNLDEEKFTLSQTVNFFFYPSKEAEQLSEEQRLLIAGYQEKLGLNLMPWLTDITIDEAKSSISFPGEGYRAPFVEAANITLKGTTSLTLSSKADSDNVVLKMSANPMGMADYLHTSLRRLTIEDAEYFTNEDAGESLSVMEMLNWNKDSHETFDVTLDNIRVVNYDSKTGVADIEFVEEGPNYILDSKGNPIYSDDFEDYLVYSYSTSRIPFKYSFSPWDRFLTLYEQNDPKARELIMYTNILPSPYAHLGMNDVLDNYWAFDTEEPDKVDLYTHPKGSIDFINGTMSFEFPFDHEDQYGYSLVKVTYHLK